MFNSGEGGKMKDEDLINMIVSIWVINGGDSKGFDWCYERIKNKIEEQCQNVAR